MKLLFDHCLDWRLKRSLLEHEVYSAEELGWDALKNGKLLAAGHAGFDVVLTVDRHLKQQQNLSLLLVAVLVLITESNRRQHPLPLMATVREVLPTIAPRSLVEIDESGLARVASSGLG